MKVAKNNIIRVVFFCLAVAAGVFSVTYGVLSFAARTPGWQDVDVSTVPDALPYSTDYKFEYYAEGSSSQIRRTVSGAAEIYGESLVRACRLLDSVNVYEGYVNPAVLNRSDGEVVQLDADLFDVLMQAYSYTLERKGYNMFAGALYAEWDSILLAENAADFDPLLNDWQAERIERIAETVSDYSNFVFEVVDAENYKVRFAVSDEYREFVSRFEIEAPALDLNVLKQAFVLDLVRKDLQKNGLNEGRMSCTGGFAFSMMSDLSSAFTSVFTTGEKVNYNYTVELDGETYFRHRFFDGRNGKFNSVVAQCSVTGGLAALTEVSYLALQVNCCSGRSEVVSLCNLFPQYVFSILYYQLTVGII